MIIEARTKYVTVILYEPFNIILNISCDIPGNILEYIRKETSIFCD